jgi:hypothetical protein
MSGWYKVGYGSKSEDHPPLLLYHSQQGAGQYASYQKAQWLRKSWDFHWESWNDGISLDVPISLKPLWLFIAYTLPCILFGETTSRRLGPKRMHYCINRYGNLCCGLKCTASYQNAQGCREKVRRPLRVVDRLDLTGYNSRSESIVSFYRSHITLHSFWENKQADFSLDWYTTLTTDVGSLLCIQLRTQLSKCTINLRLVRYPWEVSDRSSFTGSTCISLSIMTFYRSLITLHSFWEHRQTSSQVNVPDYFACILSSSRAWEHRLWGSFWRCTLVAKPILEDWICYHSITAEYWETRASLSASWKRFASLRHDITIDHSNANTGN